MMQRAVWVALGFDQALTLRTMDANPARAGQAAKVSLGPNGVAILDMGNRSQGRNWTGPVVNGLHHPYEHAA
jgi:hypothetical protein